MGGNGERVGSGPKRKRVDLAIHSIGRGSHSQSEEDKIKPHGSECKPLSPGLLPYFDEIEGRCNKKHGNTHERESAKHQVASSFPVD